MRSTANKVLLPVLAACLVWGSAAISHAAEGPVHKPVIVVSLSGYAELMDDIRYLGGLGGKEEAADQLEAILKLFTAQKGLAGLDQSRPWGFAVTECEGQMPIFGFLPVTDLEELFEALAGFVGDPEKDDDGIWELEVQEFPVFIKEKNGWAYIGTNPTALDNLPEDAAPLLKGLEKTYDLAVSASPRNVPAVYRDLLIGQMKKFIDAGMSQKQKDETDAEFEQRKALAQLGVEQFEQVINDIDTLTIGYATNRETKKMVFDFSLTAVSGSKLAEQVNRASEPLTTAFAGFQRPDALITMHAVEAAGDPDQAVEAASVLEGLAKQIGGEIDKSVSPEFRAKVQALVDSAMAVAQANVKSGRTDMGMAVVGEGPFNIIAGGFIADAEAGGKMADSILALADGQEGFSNVKRGVETYKGVTFHSMTMTIPESIPLNAATDNKFRIQPVQAKAEPKTKKKPAAKPAPKPVDDAAAQQQEAMIQGALKFARATLGEKVPVVIGIGDKKMLVGIGQNALAELKRTLDLSAASGEMKLQAFEFAARPGPMIKAAAKANPEDAQLAALAQNEAVASTDRIRILGAPSKDTMTYRIELEEGVITLFGAFAAMAAPPGGLGAF